MLWILITIRASHTSSLLLFVTRPLPYSFHISLLAYGFFSHHFPSLILSAFIITFPPPPRTPILFPLSPRIQVAGETWSAVGAPRRRIYNGNSNRKSYGHTAMLNDNADTDNSQHKQKWTTKHMNHYPRTLLPENIWDI